MTEKDIQNHLFSWLEEKRQYLITPNVRLYGDNEADLVSVSKAGLVSEYEIKTSLADFRRDLGRKKLKHAKIAGANFFKDWVPNYFYFVFPQVLFDSRKRNNFDVPYYAGIVIVHDDGGVLCVKAARRLHRMPATDRDIAYLGRGLMYRYWQTRLKGAA